MGAFKRALLEQQEAELDNGAHWGALELDREEQIPLCLHDKDKPQMKAYFDSPCAMCPDKGSDFCKLSCEGPMS